MNLFQKTIAATLILLLSQASFGQTTIQRIGLLPFDATDQTLGLAVSVAVARELDNIDNLVAPPPLEIGIYTRNFPTRTDKLKTFFALRALITGEISGQAGAYDLKLNINSDKDQSLEVKSTDFKKLVIATTDAIIKTLGIKPSAADEKEMASIEATLPSSDVVAASSNLSDTDNLGTLEKDDSAWSLAVRGFLLSQTGKAKDGAILTAKAAKAAPQDAFVQTLHGYVNLLAGNLVDAKTILETALKLNPIKPEALYAHAVTTLRSGNSREAFQNAANDFGKALVGNPRLTDASLALADILEKFQQPQNAIDVLTRAIQFSPEDLQLHQRLLTLIARNQPDLANTYLPAIISRYPDVPDTVYALAVQIPNIETAKKVLASGEEKYASSAILAFARGRLAERRANYAEAIKAFTEATERDPKLSLAKIALATAYAKLGKLDEAAKALDNPDPRALVDVYLQAGRIGDAKAVLAKISDVTADTNFLRGMVALREWRFDDADAALKKAGNRGKATLSDLNEQRILGAPKLSAETLLRYRLALAALDAGSNEEAITVLQQALVGNTKNPYLNYALGVALFSANQKDEAVDALKIALEGLANNAVVLANLGAAYMDVGRYDLASESLKKATQLAPKYGRAWLYLGLLEFELTHAKEAKDALQRAVALDDGLKNLALPYLNALGVK